MQRQPRRAAASKAVQKPRKGPKENAKNNRSRAEIAGRPEDSVPVVEHPLPAFRRIQPVHWLAGGGAGPAEPGVAIQAIGQIGAVGRVTALVLDQLRLLGKGHGGPEGIQGWNLCRQPRLPELGAIEAIGPRKLPQQGPQSSNLGSLYPAAVLEGRASDHGIRFGSASLQFRLRLLTGPRAPPTKAAPLYEAEARLGEK